MSIQEIVASSGGALLILMTLVQIAPIKVNPWSKIAKAIGKALNGDVMTKLNEVQERLDGHIRIDDERNADMHRVQILRFNRELLQDNIPIHRRISLKHFPRLTSMSVIVKSTRSMRTTGRCWRFRTLNEYTARCWKGITLAMPENKNRRVTCGCR